MVSFPSSTGVGGWADMMQSISPSNSMSVSDLSWRGVYETPSGMLNATFSLRPAPLTPPCTHSISWSGIPIWWTSQPRV